MLQSAINIASRAASAKSPIPALEGILLEAGPAGVKLTGYDLKKGIYTTVDADVADSAVMLEDVIANTSADGANGSKIFLALFPIMCIYPFLQKHFAKGLVRGSVKE